MNRKTFLKKAAGAMLIALPAYSIISCSSSGDDSGNGNPNPNPNPQGNCSNNGANASSISSNHGHTLTVSKDDVTAGTEKTYSIQGSSSHDHTVTITAANFNTLQSNQSITINSTAGGGHTHSVTVSCA